MIEDGDARLTRVTQIADALAKWAAAPRFDAIESPFEHPAVEALGLTRQDFEAVLLQTPRILKAAEAYG